MNTEINTRLTTIQQELAQMMLRISELPDNDPNKEVLSYLERNAVTKNELFEMVRGLYLSELLPKQALFIVHGILSKELRKQLPTRDKLSSILRRKKRT